MPQCCVTVADKDAAGISCVQITADSLLASAEVERLLPCCPSISMLSIAPSFWPAFFPAHLTKLTIDLDILSVSECGYPDDLPAADEQVYVLLSRLQDLSELRKLDASVKHAVRLPASLGFRLPRSLQRFCLHFYPADEPYDQADEVELGYLSRAAGCEAQVEVYASVEPMTCKEDTNGMEFFLSKLCPALRRLGGELHTLRLDLNEIALHSLLPELEQLHVEVYVLRVHVAGDEGEEAGVITAFPCCARLELPCWQYGPVNTMRCTWGALSAAPGVRVLGTPKRPCERRVTVSGFTGQPVCGDDEPWALVVYGLDKVEGLPASCFVEEVQGKHVWRNKAARNMGV